MKSFIFTLLLSLSSLSFANSLQEFYSLDAPENTPLFVAIAKGQFNKAKKLLKDGTDPNQKNIKGATAIHALVMNNNEKKSISLLNQLIKNGLDMNAQDIDGDTGLHIALLVGKYFLAQAFLQIEQTDVLTKNNDGLNILHILAQIDIDSPLIRYTLHMALYRGGINLINAQDEDGDTALHYAVSPPENIEFIQTLAHSPETDMNIKNYTNGNTPVLILLFTTLTLLSQTQPEAESPPSLKHISSVHQALQIFFNPPYNNNIDFKIENNNDISPLEILRFTQHHLQQLPKNSPYYEDFQPIIKTLSLYKTPESENSFNSLQNTPLFLAILKGDFEEAETLLKNGADPNKKNFKSGTIFHALALNNNEQESIEFLPTLLGYGADINAQDEDGNTGLSIAILAEKYQLAQAFLQIQQIDIYRKTNTESNILHLFSQVNLNDSDDGIQALNMVLSKGGRRLINGQNILGQTALHHAVIHGNIKLLEVLASHPQTDINKKDHDGNVPVLIPIINTLRVLYATFASENSNPPSVLEIYKINRTLSALLNSPHDVNLKITNHKGISPKEMLAALKESLLEIPKDSDSFPPFESIIETLSFSKHSSL